MVSAGVSYRDLYLVLHLRHITVNRCSVHGDLICHLKVNCVENKLCHCRPEEMLSKEINYPSLKLCLWSHSLHANSVPTPSLPHQAEQLSSPGLHQHLCDHPLWQRALLGCGDTSGDMWKAGNTDWFTCQSLWFFPSQTSQNCEPLHWI